MYSLSVNIKFYQGKGIETGLIIYKKVQPYGCTSKPKTKIYESEIIDIRYKPSKNTSHEMKIYLRKQK
jgi:hypothetical protein